MADDFKQYELSDLPEFKQDEIPDVKEERMMTEDDVIDIVKKLLENYQGVVRFVAGEVSASPGVSFINRKYVSSSSTTVTGDQSITGVGFKPTYVRFTAVSALFGTTQATTGAADGTRNDSITWAVGATTIFSTPTVCMYAYDSGAPGGWSAVLKSFDADGFTLTWTKTLTPAAITFMYECYE